MLSRLGRETHAHHAEADAPWLALTAVNVRRSDYMHQLAVTYGFEAPLEAAFARTAGLAGAVGSRLRSRGALLVRDLDALGLGASELAGLPQCFTRPPFTELYDALGWMYVIERATLLHDTVRGSLLRHLPMLRGATAYLGAVGSIACARWQAFGVALDRVAVTDRIAERIAVAADQAFLRLREWNGVNQPELRSTG